MLRYLKLLLLAPIAIAIIGLAVMNRAPATLVYLPPQLGSQSISMPLFVLLFLAVMAGVVIGGVAAWLTQSRHRKAERQFRREAERLKTETERLKSALPTSTDLALPALKNR